MSTCQPVMQPMNAVRGAIVVIVALVIGVVVLARGLDEPGSANEPVETSNTTQPAATPPPADPTPPPADPTPPPADPTPPPADPAPPPADPAPFRRPRQRTTSKSRPRLPTTCSLRT